MFKLGDIVVAADLAPGIHSWSRMRSIGHGKHSDLRVVGIYDIYVECVPVNGNNHIGYYFHQLRHSFVTTESLALEYSID